MAISIPTPDESVPQPGAMKGQQPSNGLPYVDRQGPTGWPTLPGRHAVNFTSAEAVLLTSGTIVRVWGGPAGQFGQYWNPPSEFSTKDAFYGQDAVMLSWNNGTFQVDVQVGSGLLQAVETEEGVGLPVWYGGVATQPADDTAGNPLPGYYLPGGQQPGQYFVDYSLFDFTSKSTPWNNPKPDGSEASDRVPGLKTDSAPLPGAVSGAAAGYADLGQLCGRLAALLLGIVPEAEQRGIRLEPLQLQAERLRNIASTLQAHLRNLPDLDAEAHLDVVASGLVGIARYVDFHNWSRRASEVNGLLDAIVDRALTLTRQS